MNLVADESVPYGIIRRLRQDGHEVTAIVDVTAGTDDDRVLAMAAKGQQVLITNDRDFGELTYRVGQVSAGILLLRLEGLSNRLKAEMVARVIAEHETELHGAFTTVTPAGVRTRPLQ